MDNLSENFLRQILTILKPLDKSGMSVRQLQKQIEKDPKMKAHFEKLGRDAKAIKKAAEKRRKKDPTFDAFYTMFNNYVDK